MNFFTTTENVKICKEIAWHKGKMCAASSSNSYYSCSPAFLLELKEDLGWHSQCIRKLKKELSDSGVSYDALERKRAKSFPHTSWETIYDLMIAN